jgi:hypothetical protein
MKEGVHFIAVVVSLYAVDSVRLSSWDSKSYCGGTEEEE